MKSAKHTSPIHPDDQSALDAMRLAAKRAHLIAYRNGTGIVTRQNGKLVTIPPDPEMYGDLLPEVTEKGTTVVTVYGTKPYAASFVEKRDGAVDAADVAVRDWWSLHDVAEYLGRSYRVADAGEDEVRILSDSPWRGTAAGAVAPGRKIKEWKAAKNQRPRRTERRGK